MRKWEILFYFIEAPLECFKTDKYNPVERERERNDEAEKKK